VERVEAHLYVYSRKGKEIKGTGNIVRLVPFDRPKGVCYRDQKPGRPNEEGKKRRRGSLGREGQERKPRESRGPGSIGVKEVKHRRCTRVPNRLDCARVFRYLPEKESR